MTECVLATCFAEYIVHKSDVECTNFHLEKIREIHHSSLHTFAINESFIDNINTIKSGMFRLCKDYHVGATKILGRLGLGVKIQ